MILNWALKTFPWAKVGKLLLNGWMWIIIPLKQKKIRECFNGWISQPTAVNLIFQPTMASIHKGELEHKICYTLHIISWTLISFFFFFCWQQPFPSFPGFLSVTLFYCILSLSLLLLTDMQPFIFQKWCGSHIQAHRCFVGWYWQEGGREDMSRRWMAEPLWLTIIQEGSGSKKWELKVVNVLSWVKCCSVQKKPICGALSLKMEHVKPTALSGWTKQTMSFPRSRGSFQLGDSTTAQK